MEFDDDERIERMPGRVVQPRSVIVPGWGRCHLQSLVPSEGPPKKVKGKAAQPAADEDNVIEDKSAA